MKELQNPTTVITGVRPQSSTTQLQLTDTLVCLQARVSQGSWTHTDVGASQPNPVMHRCSLGVDDGTSPAVSNCSVRPLSTLSRDHAWLYFLVS